MHGGTGPTDRSLKGTGPSDDDAEALNKHGTTLGSYMEHCWPEEGLTKPCPEISVSLARLAAL